MTEYRGPKKSEKEITHNSRESTKGSGKALRCVRTTRESQSKRVCVAPLVERWCTLIFAQSLARRRQVLYAASPLLQDCLINHAAQRASFDNSRPNAGTVVKTTMQLLMCHVQSYLGMPHATPLKKKGNGERSMSGASHVRTSGDAVAPGHHSRHSEDTPKAEAQGETVLPVLTAPIARACAR